MLELLASFTIYAEHASSLLFLAGPGEARAEGNDLAFRSGCAKAGMCAHRFCECSASWAPRQRQRRPRDGARRRQEAKHRVLVHDAAEARAMPLQPSQVPEALCERRTGWLLWRLLGVLMGYVQAHANDVRPPRSRSTSVRRRLPGLSISSRRRPGVMTSCAALAPAPCAASTCSTAAAIGTNSCGGAAAPVS